MKYAIIIIIAAILAYQSVYIKKLDEVRAAQESTFDAAAYASDFWTTKLVPAMAGAVAADTLLQQIGKQPEKAFEKYGRSLGIGHLRCFLVKGQARVKAVEEDRIEITLQGSPSNQRTFIETEYVYGNAVRDASGKININDFANTMDLNSVSEEINKKIRTEVVKPFMSEVRKGDELSFVGAVELNSQYPAPKEVEFIPIRLKLQGEKLSMGQ